MDTPALPRKTLAILLSGGMDSATLLARAMTFPDMDIITLGIQYGQKHSIELLHAEAMATFYAVPFYKLILPTALFDQGPSSLTNRDVKFEEFSEGTYEALQARQGAQPTYVPNRNMVLIASAAAFALSLTGGKEVEVGIAAHAGDAHNYHYPDCTPAFLQALDTALRIGTEGKAALFFPFSDMTKGGIARLGVTLQVPYELTLSCYKGEDPACGVCATCQERIHAFKEAGYIDPIEYATPIDWGTAAPILSI